MAPASVSSKLESVAVVPWLDLPDDLAEKILERLTVFDYILFGAVCRRWRSIQTAHRLRHTHAPPPMVKLPCFIPHTPTQEHVLCSVGLFHENSNDRRSRLRLHIPLSLRYIDNLDSEDAASTGGGGNDRVFLFLAHSALPYGWLLFVDRPLFDYLDRGGQFTIFDYLDRGDQFTLLNPITGAQIHLPTLGGSYFCLKFTMSPPPRCDIFAITSGARGIEVHLYLQGNPYWTRLDYSPNDFRYEGLYGVSIVSAIHYKGKFYCIFLGTGLMVVDVDRPIEDGITSHYFDMDQSQLHKLGLPWDEDFVGYRVEIFLVESHGKMLLGSAYFTNGTLKRFVLCEADLSNRRWVKVESLGDQSLFIYGNFVVSLLAADVGVKENCIYILDPPTDEPTPWSVFDFGTGRVADASFACPPLPSTHLMFVPSIY